MKDQRHLGLSQAFEALVKSLRYCGKEEVRSLPDAVAFDSFDFYDNFYISHNTLSTSSDPMISLTKYQARQVNKRFNFTTC